MSRSALRACLVLSVFATSGPAQFGADYTSAPIHYGQGSTTDPITRLRERLAGGKQELVRGEDGYLRALLRALSVPSSSQTLVFSKTSFQRDRISARRPRALYFGDEVYIGYVPGGQFLEITAMDPAQGPVFYVLDQRRKTAEFTRKTHDCLACHGGSRTGGWPGHLVRSVHATEDGQLVTRMGSFLTTQDSPFAERWGGWYVTGTHGSMRHMGNSCLPTASGDHELDTEAGANLTDLRPRIDADRYPTRHSDIVALMVLEHQTEMHNRLARASYRVRRALHLEAATNRSLGLATEGAGETTRRVIRDVATEVLEYLLFKHEARLPAPVEGSSEFTEIFPRQGPRDRQGRSLRDFDLKSRLFRFPCSYLIYSKAFDALPRPVLDRVYQRLGRILSGRLSRRAWGLDRVQRQAILEILIDTKPALPAALREIVVR